MCHVAAGKSSACERMGGEDEERSVLFGKSPCSGLRTPAIGGPSEARSQPQMQRTSHSHRCTGHRDLSREGGRGFPSLNLRSALLK